MTNQSELPVSGSSDAQINFVRAYNEVERQLRDIREDALGAALILDFDSRDVDALRTLEEGYETVKKLGSYLTERALRLEEQPIINVDHTDPEF
jgi:hypothetical protein